MEAAEIAELQERFGSEYLRDDEPVGQMLEVKDIRALLDALEQAKKERDEAWTAVRVRDETINVTVKKRTAQRDQAQKDAKAARALLGFMAMQNEFALPQDWRARIEVVLKPEETKHEG